MLIRVGHVAHLSSRLDQQIAEGRTSSEWQSYPVPPRDSLTRRGAGDDHPSSSRDNAGGETKKPKSTSGSLTETSHQRSRSDVTVYAKPKKHFPKAPIEAFNRVRTQAESSKPAQTVDEQPHEMSKMSGFLRGPRFKPQHVETYPGDIEKPLPSPQDTQETSQGGHLRGPSPPLTSQKRRLLPLRAAMMGLWSHGPDPGIYPADLGFRPAGTEDHPVEWDRSKRMKLGTTTSIGTSRRFQSADVGAFHHDFKDTDAGVFRKLGSMDVGTSRPLTPLGEPPLGRTPLESRPLQKPYSENSFGKSPLGKYRKMKRLDEIDDASYISPHTNADRNSPHLRAPRRNLPMLPPPPIRRDPPNDRPKILHESHESTPKETPKPRVGQVIYPLPGQGLSLFDPTPDVQASSRKQSPHVGTKTPPPPIPEIPQTPHSVSPTTHQLQQALGYDPREDWSPHGQQVSDSDSPTGSPKILQPPKGP